jgi:hypothetical protein
MQQQQPRTSYSFSSYITLSRWKKMPRLLLAGAHTPCLAFIPFVGIRCMQSMCVCVSWVRVGTHTPDKQQTKKKASLKKTCCAIFSKNFNSQKIKIQFWIRPPIPKEILWNSCVKIFWRGEAVAMLWNFVESSLCDLKEFCNPCISLKNKKVASRTHANPPKVERKDA